MPISSGDKLCIPTLKNFIMNRTSGDFFENTMYNIFVSADENLSASDISDVLQISLDTVKSAISLFCRLGIAVRQSNNVFSPHFLHSSWLDQIDDTTSPDPRKTNPTLNKLHLHKESLVIATESTNKNNEGVSSLSKRDAFLFDSSLTAFLMMGNLSAVSFFFFYTSINTLTNIFLESKKSRCNHV